MGGLATAALIGIASPANALTVTVMDMDWEISAIEGTFEDLQSTLEAQIWWDQSLPVNSNNTVRAFASAVYEVESSTGTFEFGLPNRDGRSGVYFAIKEATLYRNNKRINYVITRASCNCVIEPEEEDDGEGIRFNYPGVLLDSLGLWAIATKVETDPDPVSTPEPATAFSLLALGLGTIATKRKLSSPAKR